LPAKLGYRNEKPGKSAAARLMSSRKPWSLAG